MAVAVAKARGANKPLQIVVRTPEPWQVTFLSHGAKYKVGRAGRRSGKTTVAAMRAVQAFGEAKRVLYGVPTAEQLETFWTEVKMALAEPIQGGIYISNETTHTIEVAASLGEGNIKLREEDPAEYERRVRMRIRAKTCWNADTLRGDWADLLILDEWQLMSEDTWEVVGMPMLADRNGDAIFFYTPPSLYTKSVSKARDPLHAAKMFKRAKELEAAGSKEWAAFHFTSFDNSTLNPAALNSLANNMSGDAYRREVLAEDEDEQQSALVYSAFQDGQLLEDFAIPQTWPRLVGHDFGQANPAALFIAQNPGPAAYHGMLPGDVVVYEEYLPGPGFSPMQHAEAFLGRTRGLDVQRRVGGNQTTEEEVRLAYAPHGWSIAAPTVKRPAAQIDRVIALMERNRVFVLKSLLRLRAELMTCQWERDQEGCRLDKIRHEARYHLLSAMRYILSEFTPESNWKGQEYAPVYDMKPSRLAAVKVPLRR